MRRATAVVDLFCGVGGLTYGFLKEKFTVSAGIDVDPSCKYAFEKNLKAQFISKDIVDVKVSELKSLYPRNSTKILVGCAPCQPFSKYTNRNSEDDKWKLLYVFGDLIAKLRPDIVSMENVPQLRTYTKAPVFDNFVSKLQKNGYHVTSNEVFCPDYGIPQTRTRLVLFASRFGKISLVKKTTSANRYKTVRDTIEKLERIGDGQFSDKDPLHCAVKLSPINKRRIKATPMGGGWKNWNSGLILKCHKKKSGKSYGSIYGRMHWDQPAPTMTTQCIGLGNGRFGHPEQHRSITLREAALFQTFPRGYAFVNPKETLSKKTVARHIGNAVPVRLGKIIARSIRKHLEEYAYATK